MTVQAINLPTQEFVEYVFDKIDEKYCPQVCKISADIDRIFEKAGIKSDYISEKDSVLQSRPFMEIFDI